MRILEVGEPGFYSLGYAQERGWVPKPKEKTMTKYRIVIDHTAAVTFPWLRLEKLIDEGTPYQRWSFITGGTEADVLQIAERIKRAGQERTVVQEFEGP